MRKIAETALNSLIAKYTKDEFVSRLKSAFPAYAFNIPDTIGISDLCRMHNIYAVTEVTDDAEKLVNVYADRATSYGVTEGKFLAFSGLTSFCSVTTSIDPKAGIFTGRIDVHGKAVERLDNVDKLVPHKASIQYGRLVRNSEQNGQILTYEVKKSLDAEERLTKAYGEFQRILHIVLEETKLELVDIPESDEDAWV